MNTTYSHAFNKQSLHLYTQTAQPFSSPWSHRAKHYSLCDVHPPSKADADSFRVKPAPHRLAEEERSNQKKHCCTLEGEGVVEL